jgi:hypothetical protein
LRFIGLEPLESGRVQRHLEAQGHSYDLHNDWDLVSLEHIPGTARLLMTWKKVTDVGELLLIAFERVASVTVTAGDPGSSPEDAATVTDMLYEKPEGQSGSIRFWLQDESIIEVVAAEARLLIGQGGEEAGRRMR